MKFLDEVYEKLLVRKSQPATEETYRNRPIKLILEDWFATHQCLVQKRNAQLWEDKASKLGSIATVGGQYNVGYFICTQTFNLASSGVADSQYPSQFGAHSSRFGDELRAMMRSKVLTE